MTIIEHIEYLVTEHDCVIIPGIGAILSHGLPARYESSERQWLPPVRVVAFHPELKRTDGLIASSVARRRCISIEAASRIVKQDCDAMKRSLSSDRLLDLGAVGKLTTDNDGHLTFTPGTAPWLSPGFMWLPKLNVSDVQCEESNVGYRIAAEARRRRHINIINRVAAVAASFALVMAFGWLLLQNIAPDTALQLASFIPVKNAVVSSETYYNVPEEKDGVFGGYISDEPPMVILSSGPVDEPAAVPSSADQPYLLIVASFSSSEDAERFVRQYPAMQLGIYPTEGRYRIYAVSGKTWGEVAALSRSAEVSSAFPSSWICKR